jgi:hypothetical protein
MAAVHLEIDYSMRGRSKKKMPAAERETAAGPRRPLRRQANSGAPLAGAEILVE